jgi:hypothetical protein
MARTGPITKDPTTIALGLADVRVGVSSTYIGQIAAILPAAKSIGTLANTKFISTVEVYRLLSGYPMLEDAVYPLSEIAAFELAFREITPANMALARGLDPADYTAAHTGQIALGNIASPVSVRIEIIYTYPDGLNTMIFIFPRAQITAAIEMDFAPEEPAAVAVRAESKRADASIAGGHTIWDGKPLGLIVWDDGVTQTTTSSSTTTTTS